MSLWITPEERTSAGRAGDRSRVCGVRWSVTASKFKAQKFWRELCVCWRRFDRGQPGGGQDS